MRPPFTALTLTTRSPMSTAVATALAPHLPEKDGSDLSCIDIILLYLHTQIEKRQSRLGSQYADHPYITVWSTDFELAVRHFARKRYDKLHSPSTWGRRWREARQHGRLSDIGIEYVEVVTGSEAEERDQRGWRLWTDEEAFRRQQTA